MEGLSLDDFENALVFDWEYTFEGVPFRVRALKIGSHLCVNASDIAPFLGVVSCVLCETREYISVNGDWWSDVAGMLFSWYFTGSRADNVCEWLRSKLDGVNGGDTGYSSPLRWSFCGEF